MPVSANPVPAAPEHSPSASRNGEFVAQVRRFLAENLTEDLREAGRETTGVHSNIDACRIWHQRLFRKGWIAPAWPVAHGGTGWDASQRFLFEQECAKNDAPVLFAAGLRSLGPLIIASGRAEQKLHFLPRILSGDDLWCQGFSEANAGSDLAALSAHAVRNGHNYIVTGRKLWTTGAHLANRMFALVRTASGNRPQHGITFLLIDMALPGITVRPIVTLDGDHEFNEVIFEGVVVPASNRVGAEHEGWTEAKHLMRFARTNNTNSAHLRRTWRALERAIAGNRPIQPGLKLRLARLETEIAIFESMELDYLASGHLSGENEMAASVMKVSATDLHQRITEVLLDAAGPFAGAGPGRTNELPDPVGAGRFAARKYLATRAASIYSGTSEIHHNIVARQLLANGTKLHVHH